MWHWPWTTISAHTASRFRDQFLTNLALINVISLAPASVKSMYQDLGLVCLKLDWRYLHNNPNTEKVVMKWIHIYLSQDFNIWIARDFLSKCPHCFEIWQTALQHCFPDARPISYWSENYKCHLWDFAKLQFPGTLSKSRLFTVLLYSPNDRQFVTTTTRLVYLYVAYWHQWPYGFRERRSYPSKNKQEWTHARAPDMGSEHIPCMCAKHGTEYSSLGQGQGLFDQTGQWTWENVWYILGRQYIECSVK